MRKKITVFYEDYKNRLEQSWGLYATVHPNTLLITGFAFHFEGDFHSTTVF